METSLILSIYIILIFIIIIVVGYLLLTDFYIELDNKKVEENIS